MHSPSGLFAAAQALETWIKLLASRSWAGLTQFDVELLSRSPPGHSASACCLVVGHRVKVIVTPSPKLESAIQAHRFDYPRSRRLPASGVFV